VSRHTHTTLTPFVADMVAADIVCGRYRRFPKPTRGCVSCL